MGRLTFAALPGHEVWNSQSEEKTGKCAQRLSAFSFDLAYPINSGLENEETDEFI